MFAALVILVIAGVSIVLFHRLDAHVGPAYDWLVRHEAHVALGVALLSALRVRHALRAEDRAHRSGAFAALPVSVASARWWRHRLASITTAWTLIGAAAVLAVLALKAPGPFDGLVLLVTLSVLTGGLIGRLLVGDVVLDPPRAARQATAPVALWSRLSLPDLPHVPAFLAQAAQTRWFGGRAARGLFVFLIIAPQEWAAISVPIVGMMVWFGVNLIEQGHRHVATLSELLATQPVTDRRLLRGVIPFDIATVLPLLMLLGIVMFGLGLPIAAIVVVLIALAAICTTDLMLAIRFRHEPRRFARHRLAAFVATLLLATELPPLLIAMPIVWMFVWPRRPS